MDLTDRPQTPEAAFITAIIMQAYHDLFVKVQQGTTVGFTRQFDQDQAIAFLTERTGVYARHRNYLCSLIGWDGDVLAARIVRMLEGEDFPLPADSTPAGRKRDAEAIARIRARWQHLKYPHALPASSVGASNAG